MPSEHKKNRQGTPEPTSGAHRSDLNGQRLGLDELNLGNSAAHDNRERLLRRFLRGFSQFLAGMYTGESCAGTPHGERSPESASRRRRRSKPQEQKIAETQKNSSSTK